MLTVELVQHTPQGGVKPVEPLTLGADRTNTIFLQSIHHLGLVKGECLAQWHRGRLFGIVAV